ncbi:MAG: zf-TFIIB domain-containing protein [Clostridia bacterium]|nr:zf-TFIIB domain-containing protein [Clostridia bacterium]
MKCPICRNVDLIMSERQNVEIDYCPECRGIWLDKSELDKIIERSNGVSNNYNDDINNSIKYNIKENKHGMKNNNKTGKKKESFISEIFEMFGGD